MIFKSACTVWKSQEQIYVAYVFRNLLLSIIEKSKKKLSANSLFPYLQDAVNMFRSKKSSRLNECTLSGQSGVTAFHPKKGKFCDDFFFFI
jgi:hypothetical protein